VSANGTFSVTPVAPGACTIDVADANARHTAVSVTVATSSLTVNSRKH
jgi:CO dehydrogenase/acetyl-CoA synthase alpha subunit